MRVVGIAGSLRSGSHTARLLRGAAALAPDGVELEVYEGLAGLPHYDEDADGELVHSAVAELRSMLADADALLISTPEYNGSVPGGLKNVVDWASRPRDASPLAGKPVAVIGGSPSAFAGVWAQADLRRVLGIAGARVIESELAVPAIDQALGADGVPDDDGLREGYAQLLEALAAEVRRDQLAIAA